MRVFKTEGKINFVDQNNVFVGFDFEQSCSETFGYFFSWTKPAQVMVQEDTLVEETWKAVLEEYVFDTEYREELQHLAFLDAGSAVVFRLVQGSTELFLCLYNSHNGYYSHGFTVEKDCKEVFSGRL